MKLANWTLECVDDIAEGYRDFLSDLRDPFFWLALVIFLGILAESILG